MNYNLDQESHSQNNLLNCSIVCSSQEMIPSVTSLMSNNNVECHMIDCDTKHLHLHKVLNG